MPLGILKEPVQWLAEPAFTLPIAMLLTIWAGIGYYMMVFLAGLQNIPEELYDAAQIDGCNSFQKHWHVSLPGLRPQITFVAIISSLAALKVFDEIYILTGATGGILDSGVTIVFYLWRNAFRLSHAGYASAIAIGLLVVTLAFSVLNVRILDRDRRQADGTHPTARATRSTRRAASRRKAGTTFLWYVLLRFMALGTTLPFLWIFLTSLKGPDRRRLLDPAPTHPAGPHPGQLRPGLEPAADRLLRK